MKSVIFVEVHVDLDGPLSEAARVVEAWILGLPSGPIQSARVTGAAEHPDEDPPGAAG